MNFSLESLINYSKEYAVSKAAKFLTDKIWKLGRYTLMTYGMEQYLIVLDPLANILIRWRLKIELKKIGLAAYNVLDGRGLINKMTQLFRPLRRRQPAQVIMV